MKNIRSDGDAEHDRREQLSALMDGELDADGAAHCCESWCEQRDLRANWHLYHVIGDVLRADARQAACDAARSARLLQAVRERLAAEPPLRGPGGLRRRLAAGVAGRRRRPSPAIAVPGWRSGWVAGSAAAAFAAVAGLVVVIQGAPLPPADAGAMLAGAAQPAPPAATATRPAPASGQDTQLAGAATSGTAAMETAPTEPADMQLIRDARLDQYLAAHSQFGGSSALGVPSGFLRSSTLQAPGR